jgi:hypothetical protein
MSGKIFDSTGSYHLAFVIAASAAALSLVLAFIRKEELPQNCAFCVEADKTYRPLNAHNPHLRI